MASRGSAYDKHPDYRIDIEQTSEHVVVRLAGEVIADSRDVLVVREMQLPPVYYVPRKDVQMNRFAETAHQTFCPFKGQASYWSIEAAGQARENAAWSYLDPFQEVDELKGYLAFYPDQVEWEVS